MTPLDGNLVLRFPWGSRWTGTYAGVLSEDPGPFEVCGYLPDNPVFKLIVSTSYGNLALADPNRMGTSD